MAMEQWACDLINHYVEVQSFSYDRSSSMFAYVLGVGTVDKEVRLIVEIMSSVSYWSGPGVVGAVSHWRESTMKPLDGQLIQVVWDEQVSIRRLTGAEVEELSRWQMRKVKE